MTDNDSSGIERCINCGSTIDGDGVYNANSVKPDAGEELSGGNSVPISEVIEFNDGPYCSLHCSVDTGTDRDAVADE
jgi:hypothetical protein